MKYYVKQLECDDNSIYYDSLIELYTDDNRKNLVFTYRKYYKGINDELIAFIIENIVNYSDYEVDVYYKNNMCAYLCDALKRYAHISLKSAIQLSKLVKNAASENEIICTTLQALFNKRYEHKYIRGCVQNDWLHCYYAIDELSQDDMNYIECVTFNTGIEIMIHDENTIPKNADEIQGYYDYLYSGSCDLKNDIAAWLGTKPENIVLYEISNVYTVRKYEYKEVK